MTEAPKENSPEYYVILRFLSGVKNANDENLRKNFLEGNLVYLDDDIQTLHKFVAIIDEMVDSRFGDAPSHLLGRLRKLDKDDIRNILKGAGILLYGRSGMRLNSTELKKYDA